ncbi:tRNA (adenosine(37)-N6)-dimethylallyltransferase MiaA [Collinsella vaginalis]|uniref:tRNA (adenosine(37)-N6)-dimethylallyltransferase MiaA n=1 Tax=Collinsella vaginalis TaxID=1870987 RepID=UPI000A270DA6|nr:tRNA (adenosine(37)-N6)-dimethylallyltransferase MiaA [Collinsella vaginalis]
MSEAAILAITGPTAVGKSAVAEKVALALGTSVISADAMQVYRGMDIGTAKVPAAERRVPLELVDVAEPLDAYSAALYQRDARALIDAALSVGHAAVLCGGTGLYLRAALDDMRFPSGEVGDEDRDRYQRLVAKIGGDGLHALLIERDPKSAAVIHPHNVRRCIRALEMADRGISYAEQSSGFSHPKPWYPARYFALTMNRARLYQRIDRRVDAMVSAGLVDEVRGLMDAGAAPALTARQAIGYKEIIDALEGRGSFDEAIELIKRRSRRYAKRQLSWCRGDERMIWLDMDELTVDDAAERVLTVAGA